LGIEVTAVANQMVRPMSDREKVLLQGVILPVFAAPLDGRLIHLGSCFVICALGRQSLLLSAAHVFREALNVDGVRDLHHPSTPSDFLVVRSNNRTLRSTRLLLLYRDGIGSGHFAQVLDVYINDPVDICVCSAYFPDFVPAHVGFSSKLAIDTKPIELGTPIICAGYGDTKLAFDIDVSKGISTAVFDLRLEYRHGAVTEVFSHGDVARRYGPSFQVDVPISSGMSGGPVINKVYGDRVVACGINMSDFSLEENSHGSGSGLRALAQMLWPCMGITVQNAEIDGNVGPVRVLELARRGLLDDLGNSVAHVVGIPAPDVERFSIGWR
jgi:hypothetical protein